MVHTYRFLAMSLIISSSHVCSLVDSTVECLFVERVGKPQNWSAMGCDLVVFYRVITGILPGTCDLGQSCGKVHNCGKITAVSALDSLTLLYPTLPLY